MGQIDLEMMENFKFICNKCKKINQVKLVSRSAVFFPKRKVFIICPCGNEEEVILT